jgi:hypothetical protein
VASNNDVSLVIPREFRLQIYASLDCANKFIIYNTVICPVLLYGSETWVLIKREKNEFLVFERKVIRTIFGPNHFDNASFDSMITASRDHAVADTSMKWINSMLKNRPVRAEIRSVC